MAGMSTIPYIPLRIHIAQPALHIGSMALILSLAATAAASEFPVSPAGSATSLLRCWQTGTLIIETPFTEVLSRPVWGFTTRLPSGQTLTLFSPLQTNNGVFCLAQYSAGQLFPETH